MGGEQLSEKITWLLLGAVLLAAVVVSDVHAEEAYPSKPITFVITQGAGGTVDMSARLIAEKFREALGQPVLVVNKVGAHGKLGMQYALGQKPDGYTVIVGMINDNFAGPYFQGTEPLNMEDFLFVGGYMQQTGLLFALPDKPYGTFRDFVAYVRSNPGLVSVGSAGSRWSLEVIKSIAVKEGLKMNYVTFRGGAEAATALLGRHVDVCEGGVGSPAFQAARNGKAVALVSLGDGNVPSLPGMRGLRELGYPYSAVIEYGMAVRAGTPGSIREKLEQTLRRVVRDPEVREKMAQMALSLRFIDGKTLKKTVEDTTRSVQALVKYNRVLEGR